MGFAQELVEAATAIRPDPGVRESARRCLMDAVATVLLGLRATATRELMRAAPETSDGSGLWGEGRRTTAPEAALAHGTAAHVYDIGDGLADAGLHPGEVLVPGLLAVAERERAGGEALLHALVAGYEVVGRLGRSVHPELTGRGICPSGPVGAVGLACAAALLRGLDRTGVAGAMGTAVLTAPLSSMSWADSRPLHPGMAASAGVRSADLAAAGVRGEVQALDGPAGLGSIAGVSAGALRRRALEPLEPAVGRVYFKPYAACRHSHGAIDLAIGLRAQAPAETIASVEVATYPLAKQLVGRHTGPGSDWATCDTSLPYAVAVALLTGACGPEAMSASARSGGAAHALGRRITVLADEELGARYPAECWTRMRIRLRDGRVLEATGSDRLGDPGRPFTTTMIEQRLVQWAMSAGAAAEEAAALADDLRAFDEAPDLGPLFERLRLLGRSAAGA